MISLRSSIFVLLSLGVLGSVGLAHVDSPLLPEGCGSCHVGHGMAGEPMLAVAEEDFCYQCHGSETNRSQMKALGRLAPQASLADIEKEFQKIYRHPVVEGTGHTPDERLPDPLRGSVDHAECVDCHNPHQRSHGSSEPTSGVEGYSLSGQYLKERNSAYEVCLKCHAGKVGGSQAARAIGSEFAISVTSQHPVSRQKLTGRTVSLNSAMSGGQLMTCSDCHTNDSKSGPRGPHGSRYEGLLSGRYDRDVYLDESPFALEFCYSCHDRSSIMANESFPLHREHLMGDLVKNTQGTSCFTCHASHSSQSNDFLIEFNPEAVSPDTRTGRLGFVSNGERQGECYLTCHDYAHSPAEY